MGGKNMSIADTARGNYNSARTEIIERIRLRDNVLLVYLALVGTVFGVAFGTNIQIEVLLALPFVALGTTVLICQHNCVIGSLADFCVNELIPVLKSESPPEYTVQWDNSNALHKYSTQAINLRSFGHLLLILIPCINALVMNWKHIFSSTFQLVVVWWLGSACVVFILWFVWRSHKWRKNIYATFNWEDLKDIEQDATTDGGKQG
jgi:hypothetical protein